MNKLKYYGVVLISKLLGKGNARVVSEFRKEGIQIGEGTHIFSNIITSEPYLISIGENCTISTEVCFLTHDASVGVFLDRKVKSDICGAIHIGDNCFIGNRVILLYGVSIPSNTIVAAGSVVTKSISEAGCIIAGNPARVVGHVEDFLEKNKENFFCLHGLKYEDRKQIILSSNKLVIR